MRSRRFQLTRRIPVTSLARAPREFSRRLHIEQLEARYLLSASPPASYFQVTPDWFTALSTSTNQTSDRWIVRLTPEAVSTATSVSAAAQLLEQQAMPVEVLRGLGLPGQLLVTSTLNPSIVSAALSNSVLVAAFEHDSTLDGAQLPNDPSFVSGSDTYLDQYGLFNIGQDGGTAGADIDADLAWDITTGSASVVVAVIDSGVDYNHPDLAANIWTNTSEIAGNGIDDDGDGYVDDVHGYDFHNRDNDPLDDQGHGTHIAGTIGAVGNNNLGVSGVNWTTSIMPLKFLDENNVGSVAHAVEAINYTTMMRTRATNPVNVRVINASWGGSGVDDAQLKSAIQAAGNAGILFVTAAGNGDVFGRGQNIDDLPFFPASFDLTNTLVVAATDRNDQLTTFSNYGPNAVDLAAPGLSVLSTNLFIDGSTSIEGYGTRSGTSMAVPHVTGTAALIWASAPNATVTEVRDAILNGANSVAGLSGKIAGSRRLNAYGALLALPPQAAMATNNPQNVGTPGGTSYHFTVELTSNVQINGASLGDGDFIVHRQGGGSDLSAKIVSSTPSNGNKKWTVEYQITPPGGSWDVFDVGNYEIKLVAGQVTDVNGVGSREKVVGTFHVGFESLGVFQTDVFTDGADANPGDGLAKTPASTTTLRAAIQEANLVNLTQVPTGGTVILKPGTYTLSLAGAGEDAALTGDLDITGKVTIASDGTGPVTIDAAGIDRVFDVQVGGALTLDGVIITDGNTSSDGGGIYNAGTLNVNATTIASNSAGQNGGGVYNTGTLNTTNATVTNNVAIIQGGGISNASGASATLQSTTIANNMVTAPTALVRTGMEFGINTTTAATQQYPAIAANASGQTVVAWDNDLGTSDRSVYLQAYDALGNPIAGEIQATVHSNRGSADVAVASDGSYAIVYGSYDNSEFEVQAKVFTAQGTVIANEFVLSAQVSQAGQQQHPRIEALPAGGYIATWLDQPGSAIWGQFLDANGSFHGAPFQVSTTAVFLQTKPESNIVVAPDGSFVVVYAAGSGGQEVLAQRFDATGIRIGTEFSISNSLSGADRRPAVTGDSAGIVAVWQSATNGIQMQLTNAVGQLLGSPITVAPLAFSYSEPSISMFSNGDLFVTWDDYDFNSRPETNVYGRFYSRNGVPYGNAFIINSQTGSSQIDARTTRVVGNKALVVWEGQRPGDSYGITGQYFESIHAIGGGIYNSGTLIGTNVTISGNAANQDGGGIYNAAAGTITLTNATITQNDAQGVGTVAALTNVGGEFRVNTTTGGTQNTPDITMNASGRTAVVWTTQGGNFPSVAGRFYDADGNPASAERSIGGNDYKYPDIAMMDNGNSLAARMAVLTSGYDIFGTLFLPNGDQRGIDVYPSSVVNGLQFYPSVATDGHSRYVITWEDRAGRDGDGRGVYARIYDQDGNAVGTDFRVNSTLASHQDLPSAGMWSDGSFVVLFSSLEGNSNVRGRLFSATGVPLAGPNGGNDFLLSTSTVGVQQYPELALNADGFVAVWIDSGYVKARRFDRNGNPLGGEISVTDTQANPSGWAKVTMLPDGGFLAVWDTNYGSGDAQDVWGQRFDALGARVGVAFQMNTTAPGYQVDPSIASNADGDITVVWNGSGLGDSPDGIFGQRYRLVYPYAAGISNSAGGTVELKNTIVAENTSAHNVADVAGDFDSLQGNLIGDGGSATGLIHGLNNDQVGTGEAPIDPQLGPLADNGGPTKTHVPAANSAAVDAGVATGAPSTDQRGVARPKDGDNNGTATIDIGAVELYYASISGRKFQDQNQNGVQDVGELGLAGWTFYLDANGNGQFDMGERSTTTDANGNYTFKQLTPVAYTVAEVNQTGWTRTYQPTHYASELGIDTQSALTSVNQLAISPDGKFVYVLNNNLSGTDVIVTLSRNVATGALAFVNAIPVAGLDGEGHIAISPDGNHVYAVGETGGGLLGYSRNPTTGQLTQILSLALAISPVDLTVSSDGKSLYVLGSAAGSSLRIYARNTSTGALTFLGSRAVSGTAIVVAPDLTDGKDNYIYLSSGNNLTTYSRDEISGLLGASPQSVFSNGQTASGGGIAAALSDVTDLAVSPDGLFLYTLSRGEKAVGVYQRNASGNLTFIEKLARGGLDSLGATIDGMDGAASIVVSASGDRVYVTGDSSLADNEEDSVAIFRRNSANGRLYFADVLKQFDADDGAPLGFHLSLGQPDGIVVSPTGGDIYVAARDGVITQLVRDAQDRDHKTLLIGQELTGVNFSNYAAPGEIRGAVYSDLNNNGEREQDEYGLGGVAVYLDLDQDNTYDSGGPNPEPTVLTDVYGNYEFSNLSAPKHYDVRLKLPANQTITYPSAAVEREWRIDLDPNEIFIGADFRVFTSLAGQASNNQISGKVWQDTNKNGVKDGSEVYLAGRQVYIDVNDNGVYNAGTDILASQLTSATGDYFFTGLGSTNFTVRVITNPGELTSTPIGNNFTKQTLTTGANPLGLLTADFNNDMLPDFASVDGSADKVSVRIQQAGGGFGIRSEYTVGAQPTSIAVGKFDNNSSPDIAVVHWALSKVYFLLNSGNGSFTKSSYELPIASGYSTLVAADIDQDGDDDLAVAIDGIDDYLKILKNNGGANLSFSETSFTLANNSGPLSLAAGDLTADNLPEIVVGHFDSDKVQVFKNTGSGNFTPLLSKSVGDGPSSVAVVPDMTGDGKRDVVVTSIGASTVTIFPSLTSDSTGLGAATTVTVGQGPRSVAVADVDQDNDLDLIIGNTTTNDVVVLRNKGGNTFSYPESTGLASFASLAASGVKQVLVTDINKDGVLDLAAVRGDSNTGSLAVLYNALAPGSIRLTINGSNQQLTNQNFGITTATYAAGDYDHNGSVQQADYTFWKAHFGDTAGAGLAADGNGNGVVDAADYVLWRHAMNQGSAAGAAVEPVTSPGPVGQQSLAAGAATADPHPAVAAKDQALAALAGDFWDSFTQDESWRSGNREPLSSNGIASQEASDDLLLAVIYSTPSDAQAPTFETANALREESPDAGDLALDSELSPPWLLAP